MHLFASVTIAAGLAVGSCVPLAGGPAGEAAAPARAVAVPVAIDATGGSDVTRDLQSFLQGVPDGSTVQFPAGARYRVEGTLRLVDRRDLTFAGNGALVFATTEGDRTRSQWRIEGGGGFVFRDLAVRGANPQAGLGDGAYRARLEAQHGFDVLGVDGFRLERVTVTDTYGDFVYLGGLRRTSGRATWTSNVDIRDSVFERNGRQGISLTGAEDVVIEANRIGETRRATFDIEPNGPGGGARRVRIAGNEVGPGRLLFVAMGGVAGKVDRVEIVGNRLARPLNIVVQANDQRRRSNIVIRDNVSTATFGSTRAAIVLHDIDGAEVTGNRQRFDGRAGGVAVESRRSCRVAVGGNSFEGASVVHDAGSETCGAPPG